MWKAALGEMSPMDVERTLAEVVPRDLVLRENVRDLFYKYFVRSFSFLQR